ncbi:MAG: rod shape-determining protein MreC [Sphingomonadaceae bacterium]|nr:rod shape-determining protein MreC [Sphingomonadaceae bacterium]
MAPPANRRSGYSRRAQYSTFFGYLAGALGVLIGAALLIISISNPDLFSSLRSVATQTVEPAGGVTARARDTGRNIFAVIEGHALSGSRVSKLQRELAEAKVRLAEAQAVKAENRRLQKLLGLTRADPEPVAVTRLTSSTASSSRRFATIGAGHADGVAKGMPVRSTLGLVGRVLKPGRYNSQILLVTDTESLVPVRRAGDDVAAFARGRGDGTLRIRLIELGINPLKQGDVFVSSGAGGLYRPGIAIGVVTTVTTDGAIARVLSNPAASDFVIVDPVNTLNNRKLAQTAADGGDE